MTALRLRQYRLTIAESRYGETTLNTEYIDATGEMHAFAQARSKVKRYNASNDTSSFALIAVTLDDTAAQAEFKI